MKKVEGYEPYYVPDESHWPIVGSIGLGTFVTGIVGLFNQQSYGPVAFIIGACIIIFMLYGWFGMSYMKVIKVYIVNKWMFHLD